MHGHPASTVRALPVPSINRLNLAPLRFLSFRPWLTDSREETERERERTEGLRQAEKLRVRKRKRRGGVAFGLSACVREEKKRESSLDGCEDGTRSRERPENSDRGRETNHAAERKGKKKKGCPGDAFWAGGSKTSCLVTTLPGCLHALCSLACVHFFHPHTHTHTHAGR